MKKIWLIIKREYLTRVRKKSFIVTTLLVPLLMFGLISLFVYMAVKIETKQKLVVQDDSGNFINQIDTVQKLYSIVYEKKQLNESTQAILERTKADIFLHIFKVTDSKPDSVHIYKEGGVSLSAKEFITGQLDEIYQLKLLQDAGINKNTIDSIQHSNIQLKSFDLKDNKETNAEIASGIGYAMGIIIYMVIFIYGAGVMRGVMEEKTNRIAEVIISSVKPFQLMMSKIIGIALVGLTQFVMWSCLLTILQLLIPFLIPGFSESIQGGMPANINVSNQMEALSKNENIGLIQSVMNQNWLLIISCFLFYFLGGYFLYAAMFAAVGSLVNEDPQEAQQLTLPVTMPIILGFVIMITSLKDPNGALSVFGSLFPLTSPIVMMARIPYGVPAWQLITSMLLLIGGFIFMTWLSAKIYRTGILMYGKKPSWKEVIKWIKYS